MEYIFYIIDNLPFDAVPEKNILAREKTVVVLITQKDGTFLTEEYGYVTKGEIYDLITNREKININGFFVENFSLDELRRNNGSNTFHQKFEAIGTFFYGDACFKYAQFKDISNFRQAQFYTRVDFTQAEFRSKADFKLAIFYDFTLFRVTQFFVDVDFSSACFIKDSVFDHARFASYTFFNFAKFFGQVE
ncbi:MAG: Pentapeptide repeat (9 copies) [Ignavibacteria bacterium]|nr:Pentapeptide repeat (9 copies) [Ignavibacteria bacterium]